MRKYQRLAREERYQIQALLQSQQSMRAIARILSRSPSSISREIQRVQGWTKATYRADMANRRSRSIRSRRRFDLRRIKGELEIFIKQKVFEDWSPQQIQGRLLDQKQSAISYLTIYRYVYRDARHGGLLWQHLRSRRHRPKKRKFYRKPSKNWEIMNKTSIEKRPDIVKKRKRLGDYERDLLHGIHNGPALLTIVDRTSRLTKIAWIPEKRAELIHQATIVSLKNEPNKTLTNDNGKEFAWHRETAKALKTKVYFSHPYCSWERGSNENTNGLLRQYFPRKTDIGQLTDDQLRYYEALLNNRPRKCLGFKTPNEVHQHLKRSAVALDV